MRNAKAVAKQIAALRRDNRQLREQSAILMRDMQKQVQWMVALRLPSHS